MPMALIGRKCGMTRIFTETGVSIPVSVIEVQPNVVTQIKTKETDGYCSVQVTSGSKKASRVTKPLAGHFAAAKVAPGRDTCEIRLGDNEKIDLQLGSEITVALFKVGQKVDVIARSKGKGFSGAIKRHNFSSQRASHGNSLSHNAPGSIGQNQSPGKVFKGKRMAGHLGDAQTTVQNLEIVQVDEQRNVLLIKGAVPGAPGGKIMIRPALKIKSKANAA